MRRGELVVVPLVSDECAAKIVNVEIIYVTVARYVLYNEDASMKISMSKLSEGST